MPSNLARMDVLVPTHPITLEAFYALELVDEWGNPRRAELVDGTVVVNPPPGGPHEAALFALAGQLYPALPDGFRLGGGGWIVAAGDPATVRVPDLAVVTDEQAKEIRMTAPPLLAVEVVSSGSSVERDLVTKRHEYARAGCRHYWVLVPERPELIRFRLEGDAYVEVGRTVGRRRVRVGEPFALTLDLGRLAP